MIWNDKALADLRFCLESFSGRHVPSGRVTFAKILGTRFRLRHGLQWNLRGTSNDTILRKARNLAVIRLDGRGRLEELVMGRVPHPPALPPVPSSSLSSTSSASPRSSGGGSIDEVDQNDCDHQEGWQERTDGSVVLGATNSNTQPIVRTSMAVVIDPMAASSNHGLPYAHNDIEIVAMYGAKQPTVAVEKRVVRRWRQNNQRLPPLPTPPNRSTLGSHQDDVHPGLEVDLKEWMRGQLRMGAQVPYARLRSKTLELVQEASLQIQPDDNWTARFLNRIGLQLQKMRTTDSQAKTMDLFVCEAPGGAFLRSLESVPAMTSNRVTDVTVKSVTGVTSDTTSTISTIIDDDIFVGEVIEDDILRSQASVSGMANNGVTNNNVTNSIADVTSRNVADVMSLHITDVTSMCVDSDMVPTVSTSPSPTPSNIVRPSQTDDHPIQPIPPGNNPLAMLGTIASCDLCGAQFQYAGGKPSMLMCSGCQVTLLLQMQPMEARLHSLEAVVESLQSQLNWLSAPVNDNPVTHVTAPDIADVVHGEDISNQEEESRVAALLRENARLKSRLLRYEQAEMEGRGHNLQVPIVRNICVPATKAPTKVSMNKQVTKPIRVTKTKFYRHNMVSNSRRQSVPTRTEPLDVPTAELVTPPARSQRFDCYICGGLLPTQQLLQQHLATDHDTRSNFTCPHCLQQFTGQSTLQLHLQQHANISDFETGVAANDAANDPDTVQALFQCQLCLEAFAQPDYLIMHVNQQHADELQRKNRLQCRICGMKMQNVQAHERRCATTGRQVALGTRGGGRKSRGVMGRRWHCKSCGKRIIHPGNIERHERRCAKLQVAVQPPGVVSNGGNRTDVRYQELASLIEAGAGAFDGESEVDANMECQDPLTSTIKIEPPDEEPDQG